MKKHRMRCVVPCWEDGEPRLHACIVRATPEDVEEGKHYKRALRSAREQSLTVPEDPVVFDHFDGPPALFSLFDWEAMLVFKPKPSAEPVKPAGKKTAKKPERVRVDPSAGEARDLVKEILDTIEEVPGRARDDKPEYFDSITEKAESIAETVERTGTCTEGQLQALRNILEGVKKWIR